MIRKRMNTTQRNPVSLRNRVSEATGVHNSNRIAIAKQKFLKLDLKQGDRHVRSNHQATDF